MATKIGEMSVPFIVASVGLLLLLGDKNLFTKFVNGAKNGIVTCVDILPTLVILIIAIKMFSESGALDYFCKFISFFGKLLGLPSEIMPILVMRSLSGGAATATVNELFSSAGPDSFAGRCASIIMGASDTVLYTIGMYFGVLGIKKTRYAIPAAFLTLIFCAVFSVFLTKIFFV